MSNDKQINKIYAIAKWKFHWSRKAMFNFIFGTFPELSNSLSQKEHLHYNLKAIFDLLDTTKKSTIIQRLEQIEKRNKEAGEK